MAAKDNRDDGVIMGLTPKQEAFCLSYIETGNASEAYRRSYDVSKMKPASINRKAKELMDNGRIAARISELQTVITEETIWRKVDSINTLASIAKGLDEGVRPTDKVNAVKALNSMFGWDKNTTENQQQQMPQVRVVIIKDGEEKEA